MHKTQVCRSVLVAATAVTILSCSSSDTTGPDPTPVAAPVASVTVTTTVQNITVASSVTLTATTLDANGTVLTGRAITWSSSNSDIAKVTDGGSVTGIAVGGPITITASSEGKSGSTQINVVNIPVGSITLSPNAPTVNIGSVTQLTATTIDLGGAVTTGRTIAWSSSDSASATVSSSGLVTALRVGGPITITATCEGKTATSVFTIIPLPVATVTVTPSAPTIIVGSSTQLTATVRDPSGTVVTDRVVTWTSSDSATASVSSTGLVTGIAVGGPVTITATSETKSGTATVTITPVPVIPVATVNVSPSASTIIVGSTVQLTASTLDANGNALSGRSISWSSSNSSITSVSSSGLVTALAVGGPVTVTATSEGKDGAANVTVMPIPPVPVASVSVTPPAQNIFVGAEAQLTALTLDANGNSLNGRAIVWSSSNDAVATVSASGLVKGVTVGGPVTFTATSEGKSGTATVTILAIPVTPVATVNVSPSAPTIIVGSTVQLTAATLDANGNALGGRSISWSSSNSSIASVSSSGLVSAVTVGGPVTITATSEGKNGTATVTVIPVPVSSVIVTPPSPTVIVGTGVQLTATTFDAANNVLAGRVVTWSSTNSSIASVNSSGLVIGLAVGGPVTIIATSEGINGVSSVTIAPIPFNGIKTGISNAVNFVDQCPTADPAYATIRQDFTFLRDGLPDNLPVTCTAPFSTVPISQLTDELIAVQALRIMYYMSQGTAGRLPWTSMSLYDWMKSSVSGINFHSQQGLSACCDIIGGNRYIITSQKDATNRDFYRDWNALAGWVALFAHEARHVTGPGHVNGCPAFPLPTDPLGCDATYDLSNLGSYGVQYWLYANWTTGFLNVGLGCSAPSIAQSNANAMASAANIYPSRFVTNAPPAITATAPYGGLCLGP